MLAHFVSDNGSEVQVDAPELLILVLLKLRRSTLQS